jgi:hypothetical protein
MPHHKALLGTWLMPRQALLRCIDPSVQSQQSRADFKFY